MPDQYRQPYLDSSVYIAAIKGEAERAELARAILEDAKSGRIQIVGSTLVIAEVVGAPRNERPLTPAQERTIDEYVFHEFITWVELDQTLALEARKLARAHSLRTNDAIHLASAIRGRADQLLRWDDKFRLSERQDYGGVVVCEPHRVGLPEPISGWDEAAGA